MIISPKINGLNIDLRSKINCQTQVSLEHTTYLQGLISIFFNFINSKRGVTVRLKVKSGLGSYHCGVYVEKAVQHKQKIMQNGKNIQESTCLTFAGSTKTNI